MAAASLIRDFPAWPVPTVGSSAACHGRLRVYGKIGIQCYKARENVASEGTCERRSQPRMRRSDCRRRGVRSERWWWERPAPPWRPGQNARDLRPFETSAEGIRGISARIDRRLAVDAAQAAVTIGIGGDAIVVFAAIGAGV